MAQLIHLIYASRATAGFSNGSILNLLKKSRANNEARGLTGMLLYDHGSFLQIIEGAEDVVNELFLSICSDERHHSVTKIISEPIPHRRFKDWTMGYASIPREELETIEGMNDFFTDQSCLADVGRGRALKILNAFASGRWRLE